MTNIANKIGVQIEKNYIQATHRTGNKNKERKTGPNYFKVNEQKRGQNYNKKGKAILL